MLEQIRVPDNPGAAAAFVHAMTGKRRGFPPWKQREGRHLQRASSCLSVRAACGGVPFTDGRRVSSGALLSSHYRCKCFLGDMLPERRDANKRCSPDRRTAAARKQGSLFPGGYDFPFFFFPFLFDNCGGATTSLVLMGLPITT